MQSRQSKSEMDITDSEGENGLVEASSQNATACVLADGSEEDRSAAFFGSSFRDVFSFVISALREFFKAVFWTITKQKAGKQVNIFGFWCVVLRARRSHRRLRPWYCQIINTYMSGSVSFCFRLRCNVSKSLR